MKLGLDFETETMKNMRKILAVDRKSWVAFNVFESAIKMFILMSKNWTDIQ